MNAALDVVAALAVSTMFAAAAVAQSARDVRGPLRWLPSTSRRPPA